MESGDDHAAVTWLVELLTAVDHPPAERLRIARRLGDVAARGVASLGDTGARVTAVLREVAAEVEEPRLGGGGGQAVAGTPAAPAG